MLRKSTFMSEEGYDIRNIQIHLEFKRATKEQVIELSNLVYNTFFENIDEDFIISSIINNKNLKNGKKILVIKDSFANSLVPFLTQNFEEVHIIDLRSFNIKISNYMEENDFDNILVLYNFINLATDSDIIKIKY